MAQVTPLLLAELTASCAAALPSSCISSFHSEPLGESPSALPERQEDLQSAWPGFVPRARHFSPFPGGHFRRRGLPTCPVWGDCVGDS